MGSFCQVRKSAPPPHATGEKRETPYAVVYRQPASGTRADFVLRSTELYVRPDDAECGPIV